VSAVSKPSESAPFRARGSGVESGEFAYPLALKHAVWRRVIELLNVNTKAAQES